MDSDASMSILDIGLLTGYTVNTNDLDLVSFNSPTLTNTHPYTYMWMFDVCACAQLSKGRARVISKYEMNTFLSERGSLIIYLDKVTPPCCTSSFPALLPSALIFIPPAGFSQTTRRNHV